MTSSESQTTTLAAGTVITMKGVHQSAESPALADFIGRIQSPDHTVRGAAWQNAAPLGAPAAKSLIPIMSDQNFEVARAAKRALWKIVRHAGRPEATKEARAVTSELLAGLATNGAATRRELLWMLSEIGSDDTISPMATLLTDPEVREDAHGAIMRFPSYKATAALKSAFLRAPEEFKIALADSLRKRGELVKGYPSQKLVPSRPTTVTYVPPKPA